MKREYRTLSAGQKTRVVLIYTSYALPGRGSVHQPDWLADRADADLGAGHAGAKARPLEIGLDRLRL